MDPENEAIYEILRDCNQNGTPVSLTRRSVNGTGEPVRILDVDEQGVYVRDGRMTTFLRLSVIDAVTYRVVD